MENPVIPKINECSPNHFIVIFKALHQLKSATIFLYSKSLFSANLLDKKMQNTVK